MDAFYWIYIVLCVVSAVVGAVMGADKGRAGAGVLFGLFLGPVGWAVIYLAEPASQICNYCCSGNHAKARICRQCGKDLLMGRGKI